MQYLVDFGDGTDEYQPSLRLPMTPIVGFLLGCAAIYLGARGLQTRGMIVWHRSGGQTRIRGWTGRIMGTVLIALGGFFIWQALTFAMTP